MEYWVYLVSGRDKIEVINFRLALPILYQAGWERPSDLPHLINNLPLLASPNPQL